MDTQNQVFVAQADTGDANYKEYLKIVVDRCEEINGERPDQLMADTGCWNELIADLEDDMLEWFVAIQRTGSTE